MKKADWKKKFKRTEYLEDVVTKKHMGKLGKHKIGGWIRQATKTQMTKDKKI